MAWTAPRTWVTGETVTAALMNAHVRDNFLETSAATVTTAGDLAYADAASSMGSRLGIGAINTRLTSTGSAPVWRANDVATSSAEDTDSQTSYTDLSSWGGGSPAIPAITVTVTTGTKALVLLGARLSNDTGGQITFMSFRVSGATTIASDDTYSLMYESSNAADRNESSTFYYPTLTAGSNTFTLQARVSSGNGTVDNPRLFVMAM